VQNETSSKECTILSLHTDVSVRVCTSLRPFVITSKEKGVVAELLDNNRQTILRSRGQSSRGLAGLVNYKKCLMKNLEYRNSLSVILVDNTI